MGTVVETIDEGFDLLVDAFARALASPLACLPLTVAMGLFGLVVLYPIGLVARVIRRVRA